MKLKKILGVSALAGTMLFNSCSTFAAPTENKETINQIALLQSLTLGHFQGSVTIKQLKTLGDTGIGTFDGLNGELIMLDGVVYQGNQECLAKILDEETTIPFSNVTFFEKDFSVNLKDIDEKVLLEDKLNQVVAENGANSFYMIKLPGEFNEILIRSEAKQEEPYPTLVQALQATQNEATLKNIRGTIVGLYCPSYMGGLNSVGWHFHFISKDKLQAGHVLGLNLKKGTALLDKTDNFALHLPDNKDFQGLNLGQDLSKDIRKAEVDKVNR